MLTRLEVRGFKNLLDVGVQFGPFTCIAGQNGVGKSNLFDAILFLSELADKTFVEAIRLIRGGDDINGLFAAHGSNTIDLAAEMLIPKVGEDEYGQRAEASATFVRYEISISLQEEEEGPFRKRIRLEREVLAYIKKAGSARRLAFPHQKKWRDSVLRTSRRTTPFISTTADGSFVRLHSDRMRQSSKDRRGGGKASSFATSNLPRTVLSTARNAEESRTAVLVRQEMRNWRLLQLEPSALREPDNFDSPDRVTMTGAHIPAALYRLVTCPSCEEQEGQIYASTANRLAELVDGVREIRIDRDDTRRVLRLMMRDRYGLELPASALSDGTLRFMALTIIQQDSRESGIICLEEPENGIHPERIEAMLNLLYDTAVDAESPLDTENPLRQVIINTHSPVVAGRIHDGDLIFASTRSRRLHEKSVPELVLQCLGATWRSKNMTNVPRGRVISYLQGALVSPQSSVAEPDRRATKTRVADRLSDQLRLPLSWPN